MRDGTVVIHPLWKVIVKGDLGRDHRERRDKGSMAGIVPSRYWRVVVDSVEGDATDKKEIGILNLDVYTDQGQRRPWPVGM